MIESGRDFSIVKEEVKFYLDNYTIVTAKAESDLHALGLSNYVTKVIDIQSQDYFVDSHDQPIKLRTLAYGAKSRTIQEYDSRPYMRRRHNPIIDARITVELYKLHQKGRFEKKPGCDDQMSYGWCREKEMTDPRISAIIEEEKHQKRLAKGRKRPHTKKK